MIIDDEKSVRSLLKRIIDWESIGTQVVGEAASGIEVINTIDEIQPDIAIVDIRMPYMSGLEFSKLAIRTYPDLKIIILSAYNDFEYARECIGIGVCEYILKPVSKKEVYEALKKAVEQLDRNTKKEQDNPDNEIKIHQFIQYIKDNYSNPELNLTVVARQFGFNPSYFCRKFKEEIGVSFIDYLNSYRMKEAGKLAQMGELMYITAEKVGIPDAAYFGKLFKKYMQISYSEYMKNCNSKEYTA